MAKSYYLKPNDSHASFYKKAVVDVFDDGSALLYSYGYPVASVDAEGHFARHWSGYSATTMRHVNALIAERGISGGGKAWWLSLPVER